MNPSVEWVKIPHDFAVSFATMRCRRCGFVQPVTEPGKEPVRHDLVCHEIHLSGRKRWPERTGARGEPHLIGELRDVAPDCPVAAAFYGRKP